MDIITSLPLWDETHLISVDQVAYILIDAYAQVLSRNFRSSFRRDIDQKAWGSLATSGFFGTKEPCFKALK